MLFWTFEKSSEERLGTERWGCAPKRKTMPPREEGTLHNIFGLKGHCATETTQGRKHHYGRVLQRLCSFENEQILPKKKARPNMRGIKPFHGNAPLHKSRLEREYLNKENIQTLQHPPCSPDLAPCDFFFFWCCFPRLQKRLSGRKFNSRLALGSAAFQCLDHIPREDCKHAFEQWIQGLKKCITAKGAHFEKKMQAKNLFEWVKGTLNRWSHLFPKYLRTFNFHYVCCPCMNLKSGFHYFIRQHFFVCMCWLLSWVVRRVQSSRK